LSPDAQERIGGGCDKFLAESGRGTLQGKEPGAAPDRRGILVFRGSTVPQHRRLLSVVFGGESPV